MFLLWKISYNLYIGRIVLTNRLFTRLQFIIYVIKLVYLFIYKKLPSTAQSCNKLVVYLVPMNAADCPYSWSFILRTRKLIMTKITA